MSERNGTDPTLSVRFCYFDFTDDDELTCVPEPTNDDEMYEFPALLDDNERDSGEIVLQRGDVEIRVRDSLDAMVSLFCLGAISDLVDQKHVVIRYFESYGYLRLDPEASDQLLSGDFIPTVRFPRAELIPALVAAGERYVRFFEYLRGDDPAFASLLENLHNKRAQARLALARWDGT
jgi:hypothetical protein